MFAGCTKNDGDVGGTYGLWRLSSLKEEDKITLSNVDMYISFQSNVSSLRILNKGANQAEECFGIFHLDNKDSITINFTHGNIDIYKKFKFISNPIVCHINIKDNDLILTQQSKRWEFKKH